MCAVTFQRASSHGRVDPVMKADKASQTAPARATAGTRPPVHGLAVMDGGTGAVFIPPTGRPLQFSPSAKQPADSRTTCRSRVSVLASFQKLLTAFLHKSKRFQKEQD